MEKGISEKSTTMLGNLFDKKSEFFFHDRHHPHWSQDGAIVFITFRTKDSIPADVIKRWNIEKNEWIDRKSRSLQCDLRHGQMWHDLLNQLPRDLQGEFVETFSGHRDTNLDECLGQCVLRDPHNAQIVADSLLHFDNDRYSMGDFVVMPNHVHLLVTFPDADSLEKQQASWLRFTATQINRRTKQSGHFWQQEPFDHLVRSLEQYEYLQNYIRDNPAKAKLNPSEYLYYRRS
jgi:putative transposase